MDERAFQYRDARNIAFQRYGVQILDFRLFIFELPTWKFGFPRRFQIAWP